MSDLHTLAGRLRAQAEANSSIVLDSTVLPGTVLDDIRTAFALAANADLVVGGVTAHDIADPVDGTLTISTGKASVLNGNTAEIGLTFTAAATSFDVVVTATMDPACSLSDCFAGLDRFPFAELPLADVVFVYATSRRDAFPWPGDPSGTVEIEAGLNLTSRVTFDGFPVVTDLLGSLLGAAPIRFYGPFTPIPGQALPVGTIRAPLGSGSFSAGVAPYALTLGNPAIAVQIRESGEYSAVQTVDLLVEADLDVLRVSVAVPVAGGTLGITVTPLPGHTSLSSVAQSLPGGSTFTGYLPGELAGIFDDVALDEFAMVVDSTPKVTFVGFSISTLRPWPVIPDVLILDGLALRVETVDPTGGNWTHVALDARARFLPDIFPDELDFTVEVDQGTVSTISGGYPGTVSLGRIVGGLTGDPDSVPEALSAVEMSDFGVTAARSDPGGPFSYRIHGHAEVTVPVLGTGLSARLDLTVDKTPSGHTIQLDGGLMIGDEAFTVDLDLTSSGSRLNATWQSAGAPLGFGDVADAFGWRDMPALPDGLDLSLTSAAFSYDFTAAGLTFTAASEHYGQVVFVTGKVDDRRVYLFDLSLPFDVSLSDIPVAGRQIPSSLDVGIRNLEITYASAAFSADQVDAVNTVLQTLHASPLRPTTFAPGLMFSADLQLGTDREALALPLSGPVTPPVPAALIATAADPPARGSGAWITVGKDFGPLRIDRVGIQYANGTLMFALDAGIALGPVMFSVQGLAVGSPLASFQPAFSISGLGIAYRKPPLEIAGAILRVPDDQLADDVKFQFDGTLVLKAANFGLAAIGSYAQMKSGAASLFVFAQLEGELGGPPAFFVTGLMAGFGFNRTLAIPAQDEVASFPLLRLAAPPQPGESETEDPTRILQVLEGTAPLDGVAKAWITPKAGEYWLAAGLEFTSFELVSTKALLVVEFGSELTIALLGLSTIQLPQPAESPEAYAFVEMMIRVVVQPTRGVFAATAILSRNSYVISPDCHLTGGFAFDVWFGDHPNAGDVVVTLGGYHPAFTVPSHFPQVPRLGFNWAVSDVVSIKGDAYFALTTSCVMAGGGLEVQFQDGDLRAWFIAHADFLLSWHPFFYLAEIAVSIGVSYRLSILGCHKTITATLGAHLNLWGPPTAGIVRVNLVVVSFSVRFGPDTTSPATAPLAWDEFTALLPAPASVCRIAVTDGLYKTESAPANSSGTRWIVRAGQFRFETRSAIPASRLAYGDDATLVARLDSGIAIKPMNLADVTSTHTLKIYRGTATTPVDHAGWGLTSLAQAVPESLWGRPPDPFSQIPARPSADVLRDQLGGLSVTAPPPRPGGSRGPIDQVALSMEYVTPAGRAPLSAAVTPAGRYAPSFDEHTVGLIGQVMDPTVAGRRDALFAALSDSGLYSGSHGDLSLLAADAGHLFSAPPMRQN